jgi:protein-tyrosine phosphatase
MQEIFWIQSPPNRTNVPLAIVLRPRGADWLEDELRRIRVAGIDVLVSMLEPWEADSLGLAREPEYAAQLGLTFLSFPIEDRGLPSNGGQFRLFAADIAHRLGNQQTVGIHCRGSIGRATLATASALIHLGWSPAQALKEIESARGCTVPDTDEQRQWILAYRTNP